MKVDNLNKIGFCEIKTVHPYTFLTNELPSTLYIPTRKVREVKDFNEGPLTYMGGETVEIDYPTLVIFNFDENEEIDKDKLPFGTGRECSDNINFDNIGWSNLNVDEFNRVFKNKNISLKGKEIELIKYDGYVTSMKNKQSIKVDASDILNIRKVGGIVMINDNIETPFNYLLSKLTPEELVDQISR